MTWTADDDQFAPRRAETNAPATYWLPYEVTYWTDDFGVWQGHVRRTSTRRLDTIATVHRDVRMVDFGGWTSDEAELPVGRLASTLEGALTRAVGTLRREVAYFQELVGTDNTVFDQLLERARWKLERVLSVLEVRG